MSLQNYTEDELLMLSGIQHISFCERQWALIHVEQQWVENVRTIEGQFMHEQADNTFFNEWRKAVLTIRSVPLVSYKLGIVGRADIVELVPKELKSESGSESELESEFDSKSSPDYADYNLRPVEYKRGKPKPDDRDRVQLCAQAMCLEEMNNITIGSGYLFYGEIRRREKVEFTLGLRARVKELIEKMHRYFREGHTPLPVYKLHCKSCSLYNICLPSPLSRAGSVHNYLNKFLNADE